MPALPRPSIPAFTSSRARSFEGPSSASLRSLPCLARISCWAATLIAHGTNTRRHFATGRRAHPSDRLSCHQTLLQAVKLQHSHFATHLRALTPSWLTLLHIRSLSYCKALPCTSSFLPSQLSQRVAWGANQASTPLAYPSLSLLVPLMAGDANVRGCHGAFYPLDAALPIPCRRCR